MVYNKTENGIETPTMACVDGIPYSNAHLCCNCITGGPGLGHRIMSFMPCPKFCNMNYLKLSTMLNS